MRTLHSPSRIEPPAPLRGALPAVLALAFIAVSPARAATAADASESAGSTLARALAGELALAELADLRIDVGCLTEDGWRSLELFGDGVGYWNGRTQVRVTPAGIGELLEAFRAAGFAGWPSEYGRPPTGPKTPPQPEPPGQPARLICRVSVSVGGEAKEVRQFDKGEVSQALRRLAYAVLAAGEGAAAQGVTVDGLADGLSKALAGALDPRAVEFQVHRRFGEPAAPGDAGWILRARGLQVELRRYAAARGLGPAEFRPLDRERFRAVLRSFVESGVATLPPNLWAAHEADVRVSVLGFEKDVQARRFAGMTEATHGEAQARFTPLLEGLDALYREITEPSGPG